MSTINYTSGNLDNSNIDIVTFIKPNVRYELSFGQDIQHLKSDNNQSQLVYNSDVEVLVNTTYTAPSDNVYADIELVRNGINIDVNLLDFEYQNYTEYNYTFNVKAFSNITRTNQVGSVSFNNNIVPDTSKSMTISDITTVANYFQAQDFYNHTASTNVYADRTAKINNQRLTLKLYDIRGLAYMRNLAFSNMFTVIDKIVPDGPRSYEVRLSAEGGRLLIVNGSGGRCYAYTYKRRTNDGEWYRVHDKENLGGRQLLNRYPLRSANTYDVYNHFATALTEYGDKYAVSNDNLLKFYEFETGNEIAGTAITTFPHEIHCVNFTGDGTQILVSGNKAGSRSDYIFNGATGGTAKIYNVANGSEVTDLSSDRIASFDNNLYYGSDSAISGDGNTVVVFASVNSATEAKAFIWKMNTFSNVWDNVATLDFPGTHRHRTPCAVSHDGKVIVVCGSVGRIYHTTDYIHWTNAEITNDTYFNSCDVSGDGSTVLFTYHSAPQTNNPKFDFKLYRNTSNPLQSGYWTLLGERLFGLLSGWSDTLNLSCALSYDGSTVCVHSNEKVYTVRLDKNVSIDSVYDYFNMKSSFYYYNYSIDYENDIDTDGSWNITSQPLTREVNYANDQTRAYYGYWDSTSISADGRFVLVGAPMEHKVYLYDTQTNEFTHTFSGESNTFFGLRCAMDDLAKWVVIVSSTNIYFYERSVGGFTQKGSATSHGYDSIFQFKMSKDGSTVLLTSSINSTEIKKWSLGTDWTWTTVPSSTTLSNGKRVSAIDLSYNGDYIVAGQHTGVANIGDLTVFYKNSTNNTYNEKYLEFSRGTGGPGYWLHSVAISSVPNASGEYTIIIGLALDYNYSDSWTSANFNIYKFNKTNTDLYFVVYNYISSLPVARYGRTAAMSYDGNFALLSGTVENNPSYYHKGGAVLINTSTGNKVINVHYEPTTKFPGIDDPSGSLQNKFNGFGSSCRISSDNRHILVGGGGYAFKYSAMNVKSLYFPFTANGTSSDSAFTFSGSGASYSSSNGLTLGTDGSVNIQLNNDFQFSNTAGFIFSFEAKTSSVTDSSNVVKISVDSSFLIRVTSYDNTGYGSGLVFQISKQQNNTIYHGESSGQNSTMVNIFRTFNITYYYDEKIIQSVNGSIKFSTDLSGNKLGTTGFKSFSNPSVLTIYSQYGASIRNLRMYTFY